MNGRQNVKIVGHEEGENKRKRNDDVNKIEMWTRLTKKFIVYIVDEYYRCPVKFRLFVLYSRMNINTI